MNTYRKSQIPPHLLEFFEPAEIGLEPTPDEFVAKLVTVFREVRRVLRDDGTLWLNLGDSYWSSTATQGRNEDKAHGAIGGTAKLIAGGSSTYKRTALGLKPKDLIGIPWRVAFALQADGWYLRQDIIWHKPNPMPESVTDRCTKAHEYVFLLSKSARYFYDADAIKEEGSGRIPGNKKPTAKRGATVETAAEGHGIFAAQQRPCDNRNRRSVWTVATKPYKGAHFATYPEELVEPMVLAGCPPGGIVLDPFFGSGTTGQVAQALGRQFVGLELNEAYKPLQDERLRQPSLLLEAV